MEIMRIGTWCQVIDQTGHTKSVDWWTLGVLLFELLAGGRANLWEVEVGVSKNNGPQNGWFIMENPIKMDDLGGPPLFLEGHPSVLLKLPSWVMEVHGGSWRPWSLGGHAPFESKTGNAQETYGLVKRGIETVHFPGAVNLQVGGLVAPLGAKWARIWSGGFGTRTIFGMELSWCFYSQPKLCIPNTTSWYALVMLIINWITNPDTFTAVIIRVGFVLSRDAALFLCLDWTLKGYINRMSIYYIIHLKCWWRILILSLLFHILMLHIYVAQKVQRDRLCWLTRHHHGSSNLIFIIYTMTHTHTHFWMWDVEEQWNKPFEHTPTSEWRISSAINQGYAPTVCSNVLRGTTIHDDTFLHCWTGTKSWKNPLRHSVIVAKR